MMIIFGQRILNRTFSSFRNFKIKTEKILYYRFDEEHFHPKILNRYNSISFFCSLFSEIENDDEEEEEAEERSELDEDEETQPFEMYDHHMYGRHLSPSIPEIERDHEDILMIQYSNNAQNNANANNNAETRENRTVRDRDAQVGGNISISVANNGNSAANANEQPQNFLFNANFPLLYNENSEQGVNENSNSAQGAPSSASIEAAVAPINTNAPPPNNHPLLSGRPDGGSTERPDERLHVADGRVIQTARRSGRARRYQFININSRNPPVILQRMLELRQNRQPGQQNAATGNGTAGNDPLYFRDGTRVVVMDNGFSIFSNDDLDFEMVDQSGYWFGRTLANHLNNHPSALSWWQEENKISGPDSNSDLCMAVCDEMIPDLDTSRAAELSKIRGKRKKKSLEEEEAKQRNQEGKKTNEEENVQSEIDALTSVPVPVPVEPIRVADPEEQLSEDRNVETMHEFVSLEQPAEVATNISFMETTETAGASSVQIQPITISTQVVDPPQLPLSLDLDIEMASSESSASANNSRSFSPSYSPSYSPNRIETSEMNMLNRETSEPQQQQVNNLNIQDQSADHPMRGDDSEEGAIVDASQIPLPTDDDSDDSDSSDEDTEDDEEGAVGGALQNLDASVLPIEIEAAEVLPVMGMIQDMDPAVRAILGELQVPEGVDPTFLAALPAEMRDEVIQEHLR